MAERSLKRGTRQVDLDFGGDGIMTKPDEIICPFLILP